MNPYSDKRNFSRFPIELELKGIGTIIEGSKFSGKTMLKDTSGENVSFVSIPLNSILQISVEWNLSTF